MGRGVWRPMGRAVFEGLLLINPLKLCRPLQFRRKITTFFRHVQIFCHFFSILSDFYAF